MTDQRKTQQYMFDALDNNKEHASDMSMAEDTIRQQLEDELRNAVETLHDALDPTSCLDAGEIADLQAAVKVANKRYHDYTAHNLSYRGEVK